MIKFISIILISLPSFASAEWFCAEGASERNATSIFSCGIGVHKQENLARKKALENAFQELEMICNYSADCKQFQLNIVPKRTDCKKSGENYKCYRGVLAQITDKKRKQKYQKGQTISKERDRFEIRILQIANLMTKQTCSIDTTSFEQALLDLSTEKKIVKMTDLAVRVPFSMLCSKSHLTALAHLTKMKSKTPTSYKLFLANTLMSIKDPSQDNRAMSIFRYVHSAGPGPFSQDEWQSLLTSLQKTNSHDLHRYIPYMFHSEYHKQNRKVQKTRINEMLQSALDGKIGKPTPLTFDEAFITIAERMPKNHNAWLETIIFSWQNKLKGQKTRRVQSLLMRIYKGSNSREQKKQISQWMAKNINQSAKNEKLGAIVVKLVNDFKTQISRLDDEEIEDIRQIKILKEDLELVKSLTISQLEEILPRVKSKYNKQQRSLFCIENGFRCAGLIPTNAQFKALLSSKKKRKHLKALELLVKMPKRSQEIEPFILKKFKASEGDPKSSNAITQKYIEVLLAAQTSHTPTIKLILNLSMNGRYNYDKTISALGSRAVPHLVEIVKDPNHKSRRLAIKLLGNLGGKAKIAVPALEAAKRKEKQSYVLESINHSLQKIKN
ncbi:MAG: HEAT repeat domain-containing protein [Bdellovibrionaceae bacterium]|jgi:hypothetical protein|nr:HEAT repeat domain-containing protein [Pseudobdellovibrionaceae bacterium]